MLLEQSSFDCTNNFMWKKLLRSKIFAPGFCSIELFNMKEQAPEASLYRPYEVQRENKLGEPIAHIGFYAIISPAHLFLNETWLARL